MAKDDYYVIVGKILVYLYSKLKGNDVPHAEQYIQPMSKSFPVDKDYLYFVIDQLDKHEYIEVKIVRAWGGDIIYVDVNSMNITQEGIDFLMDNSNIKKVLNLIPMAQAIYGIFQ